jgi:Protein of unknown function DUF262
MSFAVSSPFHPLPYRAPQATSVTVRTLIQQVRAGQVRTPEFQRPLRWKVKHNLELFDSLWRGYPIGSLLFWKKAAPAAKVTLGAASFDTPAMADAWWVVDGQQRVTALAASLLGFEQPKGERRWDIFFDPVQQQFHEWTASPGANWVPLAVLGDLRRFSRWVQEHEVEDELHARLEDAQQRLLDFTVPAYVVDTESEDALRGIFARLNSTGARMQADEVFHALHGGSSVRKGRIDLERLQRAFDYDGFGKPPRAEVLKMVLAMSGQDPTRRPESLPTTATLVSPEDAEEAIGRTVRFFQADVGIPHLRLVPYPVALIIVSRWFLLFPDVDDWTRQRLAHWVWRAAATGAHQRAEVSRMREQVRDLIDGQESASLKRLLSRLPARPPPGWPLDHFDGRSAKSRLEMLALLDQKPRVLLTQLERENTGGETINPFVDARAIVSQDRPAFEIFRAATWGELSAEVKNLARSAANRVLVDDGYSDSSRLRRLDPLADAEVLRSHLLLEAFDAMRERDIVAFLTTRAGVVRRCVEDFLARRAAWDMPLGLQLVDTYLDEPEG